MSLVFKKISYNILNVSYFPSECDIPSERSVDTSMFKI